MTIAKNERAIRLGLVALAGASGVAWAGAGAGSGGTGGEGGKPPVVADPIGDEVVVRAQVKSKEDLGVFEALGADMWSHHAWVGPVDFRVRRADLTRLAEAGIAYEVLINDVGALVAAERTRLAGGGGAARAWFDDFKAYADVSAYVDTLVALRPDLAVRVNLGNSLEGRSIFGMKITSGVGGSDKPRVVFTGTQHAREWVSPMTVMYIADRLVRDYGTDARVTALLDSAEVHLVPIVNPDGYVYSWTSNRLWRKNRRNNGGGSFGVDLNRNWGYQWGGEGADTNPNGETYRGTGAFSEPETQRLRDYISPLSNFEAHIDFHSYSQLVLSPWGYTSALPPDHARFMALGTAMQSAIGSVHGEFYEVGPAYTTIYPASGVAPDWTYGSEGALGWTIELRDTGEFGFVLPPDQIVPTGEENWAAVQALIEAVSLPLVITLPNGAVTEVLESGTTALSVRIDEGTQTVVSGTPTLWYRVGITGSFTGQVLTATGGGNYLGQLPAAGCGAVVEYYVTAQGSGGSVVSLPAGAPADVYTADVAGSVTFDDDFETDLGWTVSNQSLTSGAWTRVDPNGTSAAPEDDASADGTRCYVTGQGSVGGSSGEADVDGGPTRLLSPTLSLAGETEAVVSFSRWFTTSGGDTMMIEVSNNNGTNWTTVRTVGASQAAWVSDSFRVADYVSPTASVRVRFSVSDNPNDSVTEGGVDEFRVLSPCGGACAADYNRDGTLDAFDYDDFVDAFFTYINTGTGFPDFNEDGTVDAFDYDDYVSAYFGGC